MSGILEGVCKTPIHKAVEGEIKMNTAKMEETFEVFQEKVIHLFKDAYVAYANASNEERQKAKEEYEKTKKLFKEVHELSEEEVEEVEETIFQQVEAGRRKKHTYKAIAVFETIIDGETVRKKYITYENDYNLLPGDVREREEDIYNIFIRSWLRDVKQKFVENTFSKVDIDFREDMRDSPEEIESFPVTLELPDGRKWVETVPYDYSPPEWDGWRDFWKDPYLFGNCLERHLGNGYGRVTLLQISKEVLELNFFGNPDSTTEEIVYQA